MLFILDSHPVQYKAPVYQRLQKLRPGTFKVVYGTDSPMRGHPDRDFGQVVAWDIPLLDGYPHLILHNQKGASLNGFRSLSGRDIYSLLKTEHPDACLVSQFLYVFDLAAYLSCLFLDIPIWIRHETQDEAFPRSPVKSALRSLFYRAAYAGVSHAFCIGQLNRQHLLRQGVPTDRMSFAPYCTPVGTMTNPAARQSKRDTLRKNLGIKPDETLLLFSGKLIDKKNPRLILQAMAALTPNELKRVKLVFVGSGELEPALQEEAKAFPGRVHFAGFVNQSGISDYYLAADILILPSRRAGETWGLVVNEALQAGCSVIVTNAVGCHAEFGSWEQVRVIPDNEAAVCAQAIRELSVLPRSFDWCADRMKTYSVATAALALAQQIDIVTATGKT